MSTQLEWRWAKRGMIVAAFIGLMWTHAIVRSTVSPGEHQGSYPSATMFLVTIWIVLFLLTVAFGLLIGGLVGRIISWQRKRENRG